MTFHIVINMENGTRLAVAAFSSAERAKAFIERHGMAETRIDFFDPGDQMPPNSRTLYVAQRAVREGVYELAGYFFSRYEAERAVSGLGFERRLEVDAVEHAVVAKAAHAEPTTPTASEAAATAPAKVSGKKPSRKPRGRREPSATAIGAAGLPLGQIFTLLILVAGIVGVYWIFSRSPRIQFAEGQARVEWLPTSASDISFFRQGSFEAAEFLMTEDGFRIWARSFGAEPGPVPVGGVSVPRYLMLATAAGVTPPPDRGAARATLIEIRDGLYWTSLPPGQVITLAWNRETGRAYLYRQ